MSDVTAVARESQKAMIAGIAAAVIVMALYSVWIAARFGFNTPPSTGGDEASYDSMAWQLSDGEGFSLDFDKPAFRQPYDEAAKQHPELFALGGVKPGLIAYRPPLFSVVVAIGNTVAGRQFYLTRIFNVSCMAVTAGILVWFLVAETGWQTAAVCLLVFLVDVRPRLYARAFLTEPLACLLSTLLLIGLLSITRRRSGAGVLALVGVLGGLSVLTRTIAVVWIPGILLLVWYLQRRHGVVRREMFRHLMIVALTSAAVAGPWAVRNVRVLGRFAPTGTQGQMELSAGYSDIAWEHGGVWQNLHTRGFFAGVVTDDMDTLQAELATADASSNAAQMWARNNISRLPLLAAMKVGNELWPRSLVEGLVLLLAVTGLVQGLSRPAVQVLMAMIAVNLLAVAVTWSVEGRFLVPQLFAFYALAGIGLQAVLVRVGLCPAPSPGSRPEA